MVLRQLADRILDGGIHQSPLGSRILRSDRDGEVSLKFTASGLMAQGYRARYRRYWQDR